MIRLAHCLPLLLLSVLAVFLKNGIPGLSLASKDVDPGTRSPIRYARGLDLQQRRVRRRFANPNVDSESRGGYVCALSINNQRRRIPRQGNFYTSRGF